MRRIGLPIYDEQKCRLFSLGRNAMYAACKAIGLKPEDEVLTPAFDCDSSLQPFRALGCRLNFFHSDPYTFDVDLEDIKKKVSQKTKLIHIINHFGIPQNWDKLLALREETGVPILEDSAYSLFSRYGDGLLGTFGDISIFSLRKNLPMIGGGMLRINNQKYVLNSFCQGQAFFYFTEAYNLLRVTGRRMRIYKFPRTLANEPLPPLFSEGEKSYPDYQLRDVTGNEFSCNYLRPMSYLARAQLSRFSQDYYEEIIDKKIKYYSLASDRLRNIKGITVLHPELNKGEAPFCLSILIEKKRDFFLKSLSRRYDVMAWPTFSSLVLTQLDNFPELELLGRRILQLNLSADRIGLSSFSKYLSRLLRDIEDLSKNTYN